MSQQLIQKANGHQFLTFGHVGGIFSENAHICPDVLPVLLAAGRLNQVSEFSVHMEAAHQTDVVVDGLVPQLFDNLFSLQQHHLPFPGFPAMGRVAGRYLRQGNVHSPFLHVVLEVLQLVVHPLIPLFLCLIHIIQLVQDHIEGIRQRIEADPLSAVPVPAALYPEISINQNQGFRGQILQFQIPGRMIGRNVADSRHSEPVVASVRVVVVKIRDAPLLAFSTAVFPDIVPRRRSGYDSQIHRSSGFRKLAGHMHRNIVHASDVPQSIERRDVCADTHELIKIAVLHQMMKLDVLTRIASFFNFVVCQKHHAAGRIKGKIFLFIGVQSPQNLEEQHTPFLINRPVLRLRHRLEKLVENIPEAPGQPPFGRLLIQRAEIFRSDLHHLPGIEPRVLQQKVRQLLRHLPQSRRCDFPFHLPAGLSRFLQKRPIQQCFVQCSVNQRFSSHQFPPASYSPYFNFFRAKVVWGSPSISAALRVVFSFFSAYSIKRFSCCSMI